MNKSEIIPIGLKLRIRTIVLKLHTNILYRSRNFGIEFCQNRLKRSIFSDFEFFENFLKIF